MALEYGMTDSEFEKMLEEVVTEEFVEHGLRIMGMIPNIRIQFDEIHLTSNKELNHYNVYKDFPVKSEKFNITYTYNHRKNGLRNNYQEGQILEGNKINVEKYSNLVISKNNYIFAA